MDKYQKRLIRQFDSNRVLWQTILQSGVVTQETPLAINFVFYASSEKKAKNLAHALTQKGYTISISRKPRWFWKQWTIEGDAPPTQYTFEKLQEWTAEMVIASKMYDVEFDGWGVLLPKAPATEAV